MTIKERLLAGEEFTFPLAFYNHDWPNRITKWYKIEKHEQSESIWLRECSFLGESLVIDQIGSKFIKAYKYVLKKKINFKIPLETIVFKKDHLKEYPDCKQ
jgi:hypothetical protein